MQKHTFPQPQVAHKYFRHSQRLHHGSQDNGSGGDDVFSTSLKPGQAAGAGVVSVSVDGLLYSFGMPMFAALTLAAREQARWRLLAIGIAVLVPFVAFGVIADFFQAPEGSGWPFVPSHIRRLS